MTDSYILVQGTAQKLDTRTVSTGVGTVERQVGAIGDPISGAAVARVGAGVASEALRVTIATDQQSQVTGSSVHHLVGAATTNPTQVKTSAGKITGIVISNVNNSYRKVAFHNTAAAPVAGTTPIAFVVIVPPNSTITVPCPDNGIQFTAGIAYTTVTGIANTDATAIGANQLSIEVMYV